uniref:Uncharacterized protein AlNc14C165G7863 n=1 Tax=Albugo laibachii Nc14 TaxID=890382 RepID=F0WN31_9STRA|nr:conserved hypothetical protein [Albugo laibachii Nc14]|eukprot:CCA22718.1 conserved hypothetical protein [Albugo laibachii Nc14]
MTQPPPQVSFNRHRENVTREMALKHSRSSRSRFLSASSRSLTEFTATKRKQFQRRSICGQWVEDDTIQICTGCEKEFTIFVRRHHCRICGLIFCGPCSRTRMVLPLSVSKGVDNAIYTTRLRVCDGCVSYVQRKATVDQLAKVGKEVLQNVDQSNRLVDAQALSGASKVPRKSDYPVEKHRNDFLLIRLLGYAIAFWSIWNEVTISNPAVWIIFIGLIRCVMEGLSALKAKLYFKVRAEYNFPINFCGQRKGSKRNAEVEARSSSGPSSPRAVCDTKNLAILEDNRRTSLIALGEQTLNTLWNFGNSTEGWQTENSIHDDVHLSSRDAKPVRMYKCEVIVDASVEELFDILYTQFEQSNTWNGSSEESKILGVLNDSTDLVYIKSVAALRGLITSRDFVNVRTWRNEADGYTIAINCAGKDLLPGTKDVTRGESGPCGFIILPVSGSKNKARLIWVLNVDIKGFFPSNMIKKGSLSEMDCFVRNLRTQIATLRLTK